MKSLMTLASLTLLLTACGAGNTSSDPSSTGAPAPVTGPTGQSSDTAPAVEHTVDLRSSTDFNFSSSRAMAIAFDAADATTSAGMLSFCTVYTRSGDSFDIDYDSCAVQASLVNGVYSGSMKLTNDKSSVVGVVWFKDKAIPSVYKEFSLEVGVKLVRRGAGPQSIVWR